MRGLIHQPQVSGRSHSREKRRESNNSCVLDSDERARFLWTTLVIGCLRHNLETISGLISVNESRSGLYFIVFRECG